MNTSIKPLRYLCLVISLIILLSTFGSAAYGETGIEDKGPRINVLFIGNSLVNRNGLAKMFEKIAVSKGKNVYAESFTKPGYTLQMFYKDHDYVSRLNAMKWDFVVLQDGAYMPYGSSNSRYYYIRFFDDEISKVGAKTVLFAHNVIDVKNARATAEQQKKVTDAYTEIGKELASVVVPAGAAWVDFSESHPDVKLYNDDNVHPSMVGTYVSACVFYSALFGESPAGGSIEDIESAGYASLGEAAQESAWESAQKYYSDNSVVALYQPAPKSETGSDESINSMLESAYETAINFTSGTTTATGTAPTETPAPAAPSKPAASSSATLKSSVFTIDNTKSTISIKKTSVTLSTFKAGVTAPKNSIMIVLKAGTNAPVISGNVVPGMKVAVIAENQTNCKIYTIEK